MESFMLLDFSAIQALLMKHASRIEVSKIRQIIGN